MNFGGKMKRRKLGCSGWVAILFLSGLAIQYPIPALLIGLLSVLGIYLWLRSTKSGSEPEWNGDYPPGTPPLKTTSAAAISESQKISATLNSNNLPRLAMGPEFDVVGESFYSDNFHKLRELLGAEPEDEEYVDLELVNEPENKFSANRHAVAVKAAGMILGHISEAENKPFFSVIEQAGGSVMCAGRVWFDEPGGDVERNSVQLLVKVPLRISKT
jgi:hypothetical protein